MSTMFPPMSTATGRTPVKRLDPPYPHHRPGEVTGLSAAWIPRAPSGARRAVPTRGPGCRDAP